MQLIEFQPWRLALTVNDLSQTSPRGLGVLHASAMGLAGSVLAEQDFIASVQPTSDDELREADQYVTGEHTQTYHSCCVRALTPSL